MRQQTLRILFILNLLSLVGGVAVGQPWAPQSVLRQGPWVRLGVAESGMHRLDAAQLQALGVPASVDPRTLRLYGNADGLLPQRIGEGRSDDLIENAVLVTGEADGRLDPTDVLYFWAEGPHRWRQRADGSFYHELHQQSDVACYYLTWGQGTGLRVAVAPALTGPTETLTSGPQHAFIETDRENLIESGRQWWGERFETTLSYDFRFVTGPAVGSATLRARLGARAAANSSFSISAEATALGSAVVAGVPVSSSDADYAAQTLQTVNVPGGLLADGALDLGLTYNRPEGGIGWLDWLELHWTQSWVATGDLYAFQSLASPTANVAALQVSTSATDYALWDVSVPTRPRIRPYTTGGGALTVNVTRDSLRRLVLWRPAGARSPQNLGPVANQNLHALGATDYVIVAPEAWRDQAERLATLHRTRYGRRVAVVSPEQCYHEFSSGMKDVTAIRDLLAMLWGRAASAADRPKYLLLFGDGSYDPRGRLGAGGDAVPSYQSRQSLSRTATYVSDDYFGFLEPSEGFYGEGTGVYEGDVTIDLHTLDIGIGRLPVTTPDQARAVVDKLVAYATAPPPGDWRRLISFVGDYKQGEGALHTGQADSLARMTARLNPCARVEQLYIDQFPASTAGGGLTFPGARSAVVDRIGAGALIVNYTGHGSETVLSNSRIVQIADVERARNGGRLPFWVTATCEFGRWDNPTVSSGAEQLLINAEGGAMGLLTSVRLVFSFPNFLFNRNWYDEVFEYDAVAGRWPTLGELTMRTKNATWASAPINTRNFTLLGDPGLSLAMPTATAVLTELNGQPLTPTSTDTLRGLQAVSLRGEVRDAAGARLTNYVGQVRVTLLDKAVRLRTLLSNMPYDALRTVLFNGVASVTAGEFEISFVLPLDLNTNFGSGRLLLYAEGVAAEPQDAMGCWRRPTIGGTDLSGGPDTQPPQVQLFINDYSWRSGDLCGPEPLLLARVSDDRGINTAGIGVGRDLLAIIDDDEQNAIVLNGDFIADADAATSGTILRRLRDLSPGEHRLRIRAWDVANNAAEAETRLIVADDLGLVLSGLVIAPNPAPAGQAQISLRHNRGSVPLQAELRVLSAAGQVLLSSRFATGAEGAARVPTDALSALSRLAAGLYVVELSLTDPADGAQAGAISRMLIVR